MLVLLKSSKILISSTYDDQLTPNLVFEILVSSFKLFCQIFKFSPSFEVIEVRLERFSLVLNNDELELLVIKFPLFNLFINHATAESILNPTGLYM
jgi:hypothetical protein